MAKELRIQIEDEIHDLILKIAKARRTSPARLVSEAVLASLDFMPRLERALEGIESAYGDKQAIAIIADQVEDGFAAMAEVEALREENETLNTAALYSLDGSNK